MITEIYEFLLEYFRKNIEAVWKINFFTKKLALPRSVFNLLAAVWPMFEDSLITPLLMKLRHDALSLSYCHGDLLVGAEGMRVISWMLMFMFGMFGAQNFWKWKQTETIQANPGIRFDGSVKFTALNLLRKFKKQNK